MFSVKAIHHIYLFNFIFQQNLTTTGEIGTVKAEYIDIDSVSCLLPKIAIYNVTVSNNGIDYGDWLPYLVYNGYCDTCDVNITDGCSKRVCIINTRGQILFFKIHVKPNQPGFIFLFYRMDSGFVKCMVKINLL